MMDIEVSSIFTIEISLQFSNHYGHHIIIIFYTYTCMQPVLYAYYIHNKFILERWKLIPF